MNACLVRISLPGVGEVACVESLPTKAAALAKMSQEDGYEDFAALCRDRGKNLSTGLAATRSRSSRS